MRQVAREPQELELEGDDERIEGRLGGEHSLHVVEQVEEAGQRVERPSVLVSLEEETEDSLEPDVADRHPVGVGAQAVVRPEEIRAGDGLQLAAALVEHELDVAERLEAGAEPRPRLPSALGDRAHAPTLERVEMEDAIGLAEADRPEHNRLRLPAPGHLSQSSDADGGRSFVPGTL